MDKIKIGIMDLYGSTDPRCNNPTNQISSASGSKHIDTIVNYMFFCANVLGVSSDHFELICLDADYKGFVEALELDVDIISMSLSDTIRSQESGEQLVKDDILLVTSCGNQGSGGETEASTRESWLSVGAISKDNNEPQSYSSYGLNKVTTVFYDDLLGGHGTSLSAPIIALINAELMWQHKQVTGYKPTPKYCYAWTCIHSQNLWGVGSYMKTGYGLLEIPPFWMFKETLFGLNGKNRYEMTYTDGVIKSMKSVENLAPSALIAEGRIGAPLRDVADATNMTVLWNPTTENAHFSHLV